MFCLYISWTNELKNGSRFAVAQRWNLRRCATGARMCACHRGWRGGKKKWDRPLEQLLPRACPMFLTHTHTQVECLILLTLADPCRPNWPPLLFFTLTLLHLLQTYGWNIPADHHCCSGRTPTSLWEKCTESFSTEIGGGDVAPARLPVQRLEHSPHLLPTLIRPTLTSTAAH